MTGPWISLPELSRRTGRSYPMLWRWVVEGRVSAERADGRWVIPATEADRLRKPGIPARATEQAAV